MGAPARFSPAQIELELSCGTFLFKLPAPNLARLQEARGFNVTFPDGSSGRRPKALGAIVREHLAGIGGQLPNLTADGYFGEYDVADSREVIVQGMLGGAQGMVDGQMVEVTEQFVRRLVTDQVDEWPTEEKWKTATAILVACTQGFVPPADDNDEESPPGNVDAATSGTSSSTSPPPSAT